jgi:hypothetical protein
MTEAVVTRARWKPVSQAVAAATAAPHSEPFRVTKPVQDADKGPQKAVDGAKKPARPTLGNGPVPLDFVPTTEAEMALCLADPMWRICSGQLYWIMLKDPSGDESKSSVGRFHPNEAQVRFIKRLHYRNLILKARQLGFTTLVCILWLDHALFNADQRCVVVAQDEPHALEFFRDKVVFAYDRLPPALREAIPVKTRRADELLFANNSSIKVSTSARGGTPHRLHVSEFGKIGAKYPDKAAEIVTGSLPAVPMNGIAVIESTAEGQEGEFYNMADRAMKLAQAGAILTPKDYRFHFFPWWRDAKYRIHSYVPMTETDRQYFAEVESKTGAVLDQAQRNWYVATRDADFSGDDQKMWQEYPSYPEEAFKVSTEGVYYAVQLAAMRKGGRLTRVPHTPGVKVNTFWDIGNSDGTAIWLHQRIGFENRFIGFLEGWGESYSYFVKLLQDTKYVWGTHYLPHDAAHVRQGQHANKSPKQMLEELDIGGDWEIVPVVDEVIHGIQATRDVFASCWFDAEACAKGIAHLDNYKKKFNRATGKWQISTPQKVDGHSEAADALRQFGQGYSAPSMVPRSGGASGNWRTA